MGLHDHCFLCADTRRKLEIGVPEDYEFIFSQIERVYILFHANGDM